MINFLKDLRKNRALVIERWHQVPLAAVLLLCLSSGQKTLAQEATSATQSHSAGTTTSQKGLQSGKVVNEAMLKQLQQVRARYGARAQAKGGPSGKLGEGPLFKKFMQNGTVPGDGSLIKELQQRAKLSNGPLLKQMQQNGFPGDGSLLMRMEKGKPGNGALSNKILPNGTIPGDGSLLKRLQQGGKLGNGSLVKPSQGLNNGTPPADGHQ